LDALLADHRIGNPEAAARLTRATRYIAYNFFRALPETRRRHAEDVLGTLFTALGTVVQRLRGNQITSVELEGHIAGYLEHSATHYAAECSTKIKPKASTNCERLKRGLEPHRGLSRVPDRERQFTDSEGTVHMSPSKLEDPPRCDTVTPSGQEYHSPYNDGDEPDLLNDLHDVANNPAEETFVELLGQGHPLCDVADLMGISRRQADKIRHRLIARLSR
jgi:hypothetical protein